MKIHPSDYKTKKKNKNINISNHALRHRVATLFYLATGFTVLK